jgi:CheY-like chemotaxis protein
VILFVDDEPQFVQEYVDCLESRGLAVHLLRSIADVETFLAESHIAPRCIVLDVMFPADPGLPQPLTDRGMTAGMPLFASLRSRFPSVHIIVLTNSSSLAVREFFQRQDRCSLFYKTEVLPEELGTVVEGIVTDRGAALLRRLAACKPGRSDAKVFEALCVEILQYLFVPPLARIVAQSARSDGHDIRDAVLPNHAAGFFWESIRREFDAKHVVVEFKNYVKAVGKGEVIQLRQYLGRKSLGRFGLLMSRCPPSKSALTARAGAYGEQDILILFAEDHSIRNLIDARSHGKDPAVILQEMKEAFEIVY